MDELSIKKKLQQWLGLRKEVETLEKAREDYGHSDQQKRRIREERAESPMGPTGTTEQFHPEGKKTPIGMLQRWKSLRQMRAQPQPNLPKSEEKGVHQRSIIPPRTTPHMESHSSSSSGDDVRSMKVVWNSKARGNAVSAHKQVLGELKEMPKPNLPKSEGLDKAANLKVVPPIGDHNPIAQTKSGKVIGANIESKYSLGFSQQDHKDAYNAHFNAAQHTSNPSLKRHHMKMTEFHMGASQRMEPKSAELTAPHIMRGIHQKTEAIPAIISENRVGGPIEGQQISGPAIMNSPILFNSYKNEGEKSFSNIINHLKTKKTK